MLMRIIYHNISTLCSTCILCEGSSVWVGAWLVFCTKGCSEMSGNDFAKNMQLPSLSHVIPIKSHHIASFMAILGAYPIFRHPTEDFSVWCTPFVAGGRFSSTSLCQALWGNGTLYGTRSAPCGAGGLTAAGHGFGHSHPQVGNPLGMDGGAFVTCILRKNGL